MAENKKDQDMCCCGEKNSIMGGFKFGFGVYLAFLAGTIIVTLFAIIIFYALSALKINF